MGIIQSILPFSFLAAAKNLEGWVQFPQILLIQMCQATRATYCHNSFREIFFQDIGKNKLIWKSLMDESNSNHTPTMFHEKG